MRHNIWVTSVTALALLSAAALTSGALAETQTSPVDPASESSGHAHSGHEHPALGTRSVVPAHPGALLDTITNTTTISLPDSPRQMPGSGNMTLPAAGTDAGFVSVPVETIVRNAAPADGVGMTSVSGDTYSTYPARSVNFREHEYDVQAAAAWTTDSVRIAAGLELAGFQSPGYLNEPTIPGTDDNAFVKVSTAGSTHWKPSVDVTRYDYTSWWTEGSDLGLGDDNGVWKAIQPVRWNGMNYDRIFVCSNGYVKFSDHDSVDKNYFNEQWCPRSSDLSALSYGGSIMAPYYYDLDARPSDGRVKLYEDSTWLVVSWENVKHYSNGQKVHVQIIIDKSYPRNNEGVPDAAVYFNYHSVANAVTPFVVDQFMRTTSSDSVDHKKLDLWWITRGSTGVSAFASIQQADLKFTTTPGESVRLPNNAFISGINLRTEESHLNHAEHHLSDDAMDGMGTLATAGGLVLTAVGCISTVGLACAAGVALWVGGTVVEFSEDARKDKLTELAAWARHATYSYSEDKTAYESEGFLRGKAAAGYPKGVRDASLGVSDVLLEAPVTWHLEQDNWHNGVRKISVRPVYTIRDLHYTGSSFVMHTHVLAGDGTVELRLSPPGEPEACFATEGSILGVYPSWPFRSVTADSSCTTSGGQVLDGNTLRPIPDHVHWSLWTWGDGSKQTEDPANEPGKFRRADHTYFLPGSYEITLDVTSPWGKYASTSKRILVG